MFVALLFLYALLSKRMSQTVITAPMLFTAAGMFLSSEWKAFAGAGLTAGVFLRLAEIGLVLLLFTDASRTDLKVLGSIGTLPGRLLSAGMLLTIVLGALVARLVFRSLSIWEAGILSAVLAPTDAGLGQVVVSSRRVPTRVREALNVEAGLNDGLSVPFLLFFMALAAAKIEGGLASLLQFIGEQLGLGVVVGLAIGLLGGWLLRIAGRRGWMAASFEQIAVVTLPLFCLLVADMLNASMFIASFVAGLAIQIPYKQAARHSVEFAEEWGTAVQSHGLLFVRDAGGEGLAAIHHGHMDLCRPEPDGCAHAAGCDFPRRDRPKHADRIIHGMVWSARIGLSRTRPGLSGAGTPSARRTDHPRRRDDNGGAQHLSARPERCARHQLLCQQSISTRKRCSGTARHGRVNLAHSRFAPNTPPDPLPHFHFGMNEKTPTTAPPTTSKAGLILY